MISKTTYIRIALYLFIALCTGHKAFAKVELPAIFSDNMVLQQKTDAALWGKADKDKTIRISTSWNNKTYITQADADGNWKLKVATPAAGEKSYTITFDDGEPLTLKNVLIGEVWVCSGQSNMEMPLEGWGKIKNYKQEIANANYPNIRLLQVEKATSTVPLQDVKVENGGWQPCSPETVADFSAVAYFFGRNLYQNQHIPIGLIHTSWGGTIAEAWTSGASLKQMPAFLPAVEQMEKSPSDPAALKAQYQQQYKDWQQQLLAKDPGYANGKAAWATAAVNDAAWKTMQLPANWEAAGLPDFDGVVWFRKSINLPAGMAGKTLTLTLGPVDDNDITWFNGVEIGRTEGWDKPRTYTVPANLVKAGENIVTVRVVDAAGGGGIYGAPEQLKLSAPGNKTIALAGDWKYKVAMPASEMPAMPQAPEGPNRPTVLYNAMIHPLIPYAIRGAIWYQGESNADRAYQYQQLFPLMIADWRKNWGQGDFPFYFVQLANFMDVAAEPGESDWAELREAQLKTLTSPNTGMAVAIDIGEAADIHPKNKQEVGRRLALIARAKVYGEQISFSGPIFQSYKTEGNKIRISFQHTDGGLKVKDGTALKGFAIAGADKKFYWADARIEGNDVVVSSPKVPVPVAVRYDWANNPVGNLYNGAGLPASPFRTDSWPGVTVAKQ
ncbi:9-O-acetylesterase [Pontibacter sp. 172403-2]|uniref:sialate O-acetylesterase n=1 Tax=Pontibacter rufus TaxID=2791028 RepID=UPI0018AFF0E0|nr:sialate O-acetylesterase [Pontibacter sp. 172403-2]MBF9252861.1 9-O-acetylesterase [Pontibacter sp. 172403-2]